MFTEVKLANCLCTRNTTLLSIDRLEDMWCVCVCMKARVCLVWVEKATGMTFPLHSSTMNTDGRRARTPRSFSPSLFPTKAWYTLVFIYFIIISNMDRYTMQGILIHLFAGVFIVRLLAFKENASTYFLYISAVKAQGDLKWEDFYRALISRL